MEDFDYTSGEVTDENPRGMKSDPTGGSEGPYLLRGIYLPKHYATTETERVTFPTPKNVSVTNIPTKQGQIDPLLSLCACTCWLSQTRDPLSL